MDWYLRGVQGTTVGLLAGLMLDRYVRHNEFDNADYGVLILGSFLWPLLWCWLGFWWGRYFIHKLRG